MHPSLGDEVEAERFAKERCTRDLHPPTRDEKTWPTTRATGRSAIVFVIDYPSPRKLDDMLSRLKEFYYVIMISKLLLKSKNNYLKNYNNLVH